MLLAISTNRAAARAGEAYSVDHVCAPSEVARHVA